MNGTAYHIETDPMLARLKRLPLRLRIAHLVALIVASRRVRHVPVNSSFWWLP
jgi:hypothetical protein